MPEKICEVCKAEFVKRATEAMWRWEKRRSCSPGCGNVLGAKTRSGHVFYPGRWSNHLLKSKGCAVCLKTFEQPKGVRGRAWKNRLTCSIICRSAYNRQKNHGFKKGHRQNIGNTFSKGHIPSNKKYTEPKECVICKELFTRKVGMGIATWNRMKTCSKACGLKSMVQNHDYKKGSVNPNWKGGTTPLRQKISSLQAYKDWRKSVYKRDDYTCQSCKKRGVFLNADHIKPYSQIIAENGIIDVEQAKSCLELWDISNGRTLCVGCHRQTSTYGGNSRTN
jgi:5-methylcytosine-specific restriction endonuclease McrA